MMRYILVVVALLAGLAGIGFVAQHHKVVYGVYEGVGVAYEGHYFLIDGQAVKSPVNATVLKGKFILWGGYLINGTEVKPSHVKAAVVSGDVVVVVGEIEVLTGEVSTFGNFTVVRGKPAKVVVIDGHLYHPLYQHPK
jgi:hypothetical protein